jgi:thiol-disulfide isomerase/thioredoxin
MFKKTTLLALFTLILLTASSKEKKTYSKGKEIWANSFIDKKAPEFIVDKWLSEEPILENKYILIDFWATWCGPCRKVIPELNSFYKEFKDKLIVIGISSEPEEIIKQFNNPGIEYYSAIDPQKRMSKSLGIRGIPHCILINPDGIVIWEGFPLLNEHELTAQVLRELIYKE